MSLTAPMRLLQQLDSGMWHLAVAGSLAVLLYLGLRGFASRRWPLHRLWLVLGLLLLLRFILPFTRVSPWHLERLLPDPRSVATFPDPASVPEPGLLSQVWREILFGIGLLHGPLAWVWLAGVLAGLVLLARKLVRLHARDRTSRRAEGSLLETFDRCLGQAGMNGTAVSCRVVPGSAQAWTSGLRRPVVHIGEDLVDRLEEDPLRAVLLHELAHVRARDAWTTLLLRTATLLHWFNPLVWILAHLVYGHREAVRDQQAARWFSKGRRDARTRYAAALLGVASGPARTARTAPFAPGAAGELGARLKNLLSPGSSSRGGRIAALFVAILCGAGLLASLSRLPVLHLAVTTDFFNVRGLRDVEGRSLGDVREFHQWFRLDHLPGKPTFHVAWSGDHRDGEPRVAFKKGPGHERGWIVMQNAGGEEGSLRFRFMGTATVTLDGERAEGFPVGLVGDEAVVLATDGSPWEIEDDGTVSFGRTLEDEGRTAVLAGVGEKNGDPTASWRAKTREATTVTVTYRGRRSEPFRIAIDDFVFQDLGW